MKVMKKYYLIKKNGEEKYWNFVVNGWSKIGSYYFSKETATADIENYKLDGTIVFDEF